MRTVNLKFKSAVARMRGRVGILCVASQTDYLTSQHICIPVIYSEVQVGRWELLNKKPTTTKLIWLF